MGSNKPPVLIGPPLEFTDACNKPIKIPEQELNQGEVEQFWMKDRLSLVICGSRHLSLARFYEFRDSLLRGDEE